MRRFFKTGPGEYGEGDQFWGISVPDQRKIVKQHLDLPLNEVDQLIQDPIHECRLTGLLLLVAQFQRTRERTEKSRICQLLLSRTECINNWDLVDSCAPQILGEFLIHEKDRRVLLKLAKSKSVWEQRIAVVANQSLIKQGEFDMILKIAQKLLSHQHDLIHKAVGWMLREVGDRDPKVLRAFLDQHAHLMPRTMLRYAIEKFAVPERQRYLSR